MSESGPFSLESEGATIELSIPITEPKLFKYGATAPLLNLLVDNPHMKFSMRKVAELADYSAGSVRNAVEVLEANGVVTVHEEENARRVQINHDVLDKPEDSILSIPQTEFQIPTRDAIYRLKEELDEVLGIVLFGSVARGTADRKSDIDLWVLVRDSANQQQHDANKIGEQLEEQRYPDSIRYKDWKVPKEKQIEFDTEFLEETVEETLEEVDTSQKIEQIKKEIKQLEESDTISSLELKIGSEYGDRYQFEIIVESVKSALAQAGHIDEELFIEGITLVNSEELERVKAEVLEDE